MNFQYSSYTDIGMRTNNEDSLGTHKNGNSLIAVVADGLGGHANGEIASKLAVDALLEYIEKKEIDEDELLYAILNASDVICKADINGHTTIAALWLKESYAVAAHVGDSRIYQFRDGKIIFQSVDHSVVQMAVLIGELEPDAVRHHKDRNKVFRVLGEYGEKPKVDSTELNIQPGDRFLLCSDGFWEPVLEADMIRTITETDTVEHWLNAMRQIIEYIQDPKQDNNSAICIMAI